MKAFLVLGEPEETFKLGVGMKNDQGAQCCDEQYSDESLMDYMGRHSSVEPASYFIDDCQKPAATKRK